MNMRILRFAALALVLVAFTACKKGGGYLRTAPEPVAIP
jgi:hypothetical protein